MPEGSWKCEKCNNINYPFRTKCNRQNCGAEKPSESHSPGPSSNEDDQVRCCKHVYLSLMFTLCDNSRISEFQEIFSCILLQEINICRAIYSINFLFHYLLHLLICHVVVTVSPRTIMWVEKVQSHRQRRTLDCLWSVVSYSCGHPYEFLHP